MEELGVLENIEHRQFVCPADEFKKITEPEGCQISIAQHSTASIDDDSISDDEDEYLDNNDTKYLDIESKEERSKRDFISVSLNANRDVTGMKLKLAEIIGDENDEEFIRQSCDHSIHSYLEVHKRYSRLDKFESLITKEDFVDLGNKELVYKRVLNPTGGAQVGMDTVVIYNLALWAEGVSDPFDSTWLRRTTMITDFSQDSILPGIGALLLSCRRGELCEAIIKPKAAYGDLGVPPRIPPKANIFCLVEIVKVIKKDKINWLTFNREEAREKGLTFEDFWQAADEARKRGNYYFTEKYYRIAIDRYKAGINILETLAYKGDNEEIKYKELLFKLYNNVARAANAAGEPRFALFACKQADLIDPNNGKTLWNQLQAWKMRCHHEKALSVAERAMRINKQLRQDPSSLRYFQMAARELEEIIKNDRKNQTLLYKAMAKSIVG